MSRSPADSGAKIGVLKWVIDRVRGRAKRKETHLGLVPRVEDLDLTGLGMPREKVEEALAVNDDEWKAEFQGAGEFYKTLEPRLPKALELQRQLLACRLP